MSITPWGNSITGVVKTYTRNLGLPSGPPNEVSTSVLFSNKQKILDGSAPLRKGWRDPTVFRSYVCELKSFGFSYEATNSLGTLRYLHYGDRSYPASTADIYVGTSGTGRFPRTSLNLRNRVQSEALSKLKTDQMSLGESLFQMKQTLGLLSSSLLAAAKAISQARAGNYQGMIDTLLDAQTGFTGPLNRRDINRRLRKQPPRYFDGVSKRWLEYQYGWAPLISDISGLLALAKEQQKSNKQHLTAYRHLTEYEPLPTNPNPSGFGRYQTSGTIKNGAICRIDVEVTDPSFYLKDALGLTNPFSLAWDLVPFSFVIDWLIPIGQAIRNLSARFGISFLGASLTSYTVADVRYEYCAFPRFVHGQPMTYQVNSLSTHRTVFATLPLSVLYVKLPFNFTRAATALALLNQQKLFR